MSAGSQSSITIPLGTYTTATRWVGDEFPLEATAGRIASSNGKAMAAPAPRSNVRRDSGGEGIMIVMAYTFYLAAAGTGATVFRI